MGPHTGVAGVLDTGDARSRELESGELATILEFPKPDGRCSTTGCDRPARMALGAARPVAGVGPDGRTTRPLGWHEVVMYDWRAAATSASASLYCKRCGLERLTLMVGLYVVDDDTPALDPAGQPADPNATMLANLTRDCGPRVLDDAGK